MTYSKFLIKDAWKILDKYSESDEHYNDIRNDLLHAIWLATENDDIDTLKEAAIIINKYDDDNDLIVLRCLMFGIRPDDEDDTN